MTVPAEGDVHSFERTFTAEDVRRFAEVSGDDQPRHVEPDEDGRVMVHGLLTATLPTKIGSDLEVLASTMEFAFHRPVYTGETVACRWTNETVEEREDRYLLAGSVVCRNEDDERVLTGTARGLIWKESAGVEG